MVGSAAGSCGHFDLVYNSLQVSCLCLPPTLGQDNLLKVNWQNVTYPTIRIAEGGSQSIRDSRLGFKKEYLLNLSYDEERRQRNGPFNVLRVDGEIFSAAVGIGSSQVIHLHLLTGPSMWGQP
jgi:hypothetical protein